MRSPLATARPDAERQGAVRTARAPVAAWCGARLGEKGKITRTVKLANGCSRGRLPRRLHLCRRAILPVPRQQGPSRELVQSVHDELVNGFEELVNNAAFRPRRTCGRPKPARAGCQPVSCARTRPRACFRNRDRSAAAFRTAHVLACFQDGPLWVPLPEPALPAALLPRCASTEVLSSCAVSGDSNPLLLPVGSPHRTHAPLVGAETAEHEQTDLGSGSLGVPAWLILPRPAAWVLSPGWVSAACAPTPPFPRAHSRKPSSAACQATTKHARF